MSGVPCTMPGATIVPRVPRDAVLVLDNPPVALCRRHRCVADTARVLASYAAYAFLYDRAGLDAALRMPKVVPQQAP